ncbi:elongation factor P maturation arginine rhamnosyltransferase EarP [Treponema sp.]|uniref:elongation factor P maturation arginine rhamnosyltransferase EarP n=1 Tax=Treponema sp. TaxID=166 RepID=UPI0025D1EA2D|nr:elongation factor P maturation arginine rhamnosyltransferase EarP [Treponema sp.]MCR5218643.1 elongation factor P maturation arginine rhamnosyltransferase EarP [Treponema sp.]
MKRITLLCKVVDNYGDIGFVYRLSRSLKELYAEQFQLTLVVSNLESFSRLCPQIDKNLALQEYNGWTILDWNNEKESAAFINDNFPDVILECFQCGRPEWLDNLLFNEKRQGVLIVNLEYLTAEEWADDFHLLKSGTRSAGVKKINFMPGFTDKTGGLVLDNEFMESLKDKNAALKKVQDFISEASKKSLEERSDFNVLVFSYQRDFSYVARALQDFAHSAGKNIRIFAAPGLSHKSILSAVKDCSNIIVEELPYLCQTSWDALLCLMDFNFIRGEDSFSRASLSGLPFIWDIYPQEDQFHLVKLYAFLNRLKPYFEDSDLFDRFSRLSLAYNYDFKESLCPESRSIVEENGLDIYTDRDFCFKELLFLLNNYQGLKTSFALFSKKILSNGNLTLALAEVLKNYF